MWSMSNLENIFKIKYLLEAEIVFLNEVKHL